MDPHSETESKLISLISQILFWEEATGSDSDSDSDSESESELISIVAQIISLVRSMDFDSQPKPESELMSLMTQIISRINPKDLDSLPKPLSELISFITQLDNSKSGSIFEKLAKTLKLKPVPKLKSAIHRIISLVTSMHAKSGKFISLSPLRKVKLKTGRFCGIRSIIHRMSNNKWDCLPHRWEIIKSTGGEDTRYFHCEGCNGENHQEYEHAQVEVKNLLHPKHQLQLVLLKEDSLNRECYCCDEYLKRIFYYCSACDFAMNIACVVKPPVLSIDNSKWHEHTLHLFSSQAPLPCDVCALVHSTSSFYICPPCGFVVHQTCLSLPRVIRISRHHHRISFTPSFKKGDWSCGVCRRKIDNDYGGYSCIKDGCSYGAHARCATQSNVWDGKDLEGEPEEIEEEVLEPFVTISKGIIQHFSHQHHHLKLDEDTSRDYDENKLCQACLTPVYFGNFYSCMQCDYILHETCANLFRKIHHPIHPHLLTLMGGYDGVPKHVEYCTTCPFWCAGFFYECSEKGCRFKLHVQCAKIPEPLVHASHMHHLFLTSKPGEERECSVCKEPEPTNDTFNCLECDFALCFACAALPQKVRYKHDKHTLTLSYGEEKSTMTYWCEACEQKVNPKERFYNCDENCCVTLHIECLMGEDLYMKPGSSWICFRRKVDVLPNKICRPICTKCKKRCPHKMVFKSSGFIHCSLRCIPMGL